MAKYQNLHNHTTTSDGKLTYLQVLQISAQNNINIVAFTDHDSLPSEKDLKNLRLEKSIPVDWVAGIEITSGLPKELGGKPYSNFHIVGLFVNPFEQKLLKHCCKMQSARRERMQRIVKNLQKHNFDITQKDVLKESKGEITNRRFIAQALMKKAKNQELVLKIKDRMEKEAQKNPETKKKYEKMIVQGKGQYPYKLLLSKDAYIKGVYVDYLYGLSLEKTVALIRNAGGVAIQAHWSLTKHKVDLELTEKLIKEKRLDGLEVVYNARMEGRRQEILTDMRALKQVTERHHALESGGADSHNKKDIVDFAADTYVAKKTIGMTEKIIDQSKVDTTWSSFT